MINFKRREDRLPSALILVSIGLLAVTLLYMVFVPMPNAAGVAKGRNLSRQKIQKEIEDAKARSSQLEKQTRPWLWKGNADTITSTVLAQLTDQANQRSLKMTAFRPQKPQLLDGVTELPYNVQLAGPYPVVRAMVDALDSPRSRLALRLVQIASSDASSSAVTATLGLSAYTEATEPQPSSAPKARTGGTHG